MKAILKLLFLVWMAMSGMAYANEHGGGGGGAGGIVKFEPLVINLQNGSYINFVVQLKLADPVSEPIVKGFMPAMRHEIIKSLIGKDPVVVQSATFIGSYSHQVTDMLNKLLEDEYVKDVFFDSWMVQ